MVQFKGQYPYLTFLLLIFFTSCIGESGTTVVEGTVVDDVTGSPVAGAEVLLQSSGKGSGGVGGYGTVEKHQTDENGNFSFRFDADGNRFYVLNGWKENYYFGSLEDVDINSGRRNKNLKLKLQSIAYIKYYTKDVDSVPGYQVSFNNGLCWGNNTFGRGKDTSVICRAFGNKTNTLIWTTYKNGEQVGNSRDVYLPAHDTTTVEVFY